MTTKDDIIADAQAILQDEAGSYWPQEDLERYFDEGQLEFCIDARPLRGEAPILSRENLVVHNLPEDLLDIIRLERDDGVKLCPTSSGELEDVKGGAWRDNTGDPTHFYMDLDGEGQFRLYPRPTTDFHSNSVAFSKGEMKPAMFDIELGSVKSIHSMGDRLFVVDETYFYEFNDCLCLLRKIAHGFTITQRLFIRPVPLTVKAKDTHVSAVADVGDVWLWHDKTVKIVELDGSVTTVTSSLVSRITGVAEFHNEDALAVGWSSVDGKLNYSNIELWFPTQYIPTSSYPTAGIVHSLASADSVEVLGGGSGPRHVMDEFGNWSDSTGTLTDPRDTALDLFTSLNMPNVSDLSYYFDEEKTLLAGNAYLVHRDYNSVWQGLANQEEYGFIVNIDDIEMSSNYGLLADIADSEEGVFFNTFVGVVASITDQDKHPTVFYARAPIPGHFELREIDAKTLRHYILHRAWEKDDEQQNLAKSEMHRAKFDVGVGKAGRRSNQNFTKKPRRTRGRHF